MKFMAIVSCLPLWVISFLQSFFFFKKNRFKIKPDPSRALNSRINPLGYAGFYSKWIIQSVRRKIIGISILKNKGFNPLVGVIIELCKGYRPFCVNN